jgi:hypothetical protein
MVRAGTQSADLVVDFVRDRLSGIAQTAGNRPGDPAENPAKRARVRPGGIKKWQRTPAQGETSTTRNCATQKPLHDTNRNDMSDATFITRRRALGQHQQIAQSDCRRSYPCAASVDTVDMTRKVVYENED